MMVKKITSLLVVVLMIANLFTVALADTYVSVGDNLYTGDMYNKSSNVLIEDGKISIDYERLTAEDKEYRNFFAAASDKISEGEQYRVKYKIITTDVSGHPEICISSHTGDVNPQLYGKTVYHTITEVGEISDEYIVTALPLTGTDDMMLRSYFCFDVGDKLNCTVEIEVTKVRQVPDTAEIICKVDGQNICFSKIDDKKYLFLPSSANLSALYLEGNVTLKGDNANAIELGYDGAEYDLNSIFDSELKTGVAYPVNAYIENNLEETFYIIKASNISTIYITSDKTIDELNSNKSVEGKGEAFVIDAKGKLINKNTTLKKIKGRGNTSWTNSGGKKAYNMNLDKKAELIAGAGSAKKWCLISDNCQGEWIHEGAGFANLVTYNLYKAIDGAYNFECENFNLYVNGEYRGVYLLTEKIEIGTERINIKPSVYTVEDELETTTVIQKDGLNDRVKLPMYWGEVDTTNAVEQGDEDSAIASGVQAYQYATSSELEGGISGGFLLELDRNFYGEASWFVTRRGYPYTLKEPEFATKEQVQKIAAYVQEYEDAVFSDTGYNAKGKYYADYINMDSFAKKLIIDMVSAQTDTFITSCYFDIDVDDMGEINSTIIAGPAWDYDGSNYGNSYTMGLSNTSPDAGGYCNQKYMIGQLMKHGDFTEALSKLNAGDFNDAWNDMLSTGVDEFIAKLSDSQAMNTILWQTDKEGRIGGDPGDLAGFKSNLQYRDEYWPSFWQNKLGGVNATKDGKNLVANVTGLDEAESYQRLKLSDDKQSYAEISGATGKTFAPEESGIYAVKVTGESLKGAKVTLMYSNPIEILPNDFEIKNLVTDSGISFDVVITMTDSPNSVIAAVAYDANGALVELKTYGINNLQTISFGDEAKLVKVMWWNAIDKMLPIRHAEKIEVLP